MEFRRLSGGFRYGNFPVPVDNTPDLIAVLPFSVRGNSQYAYLQDGMVDLLTGSLDGTGDLHAVDPNVLAVELSRQRRTVMDVATGREVSRRLGADLLTVDTNLQRVAELQGVRCRNLDRLAGALRPVVVPGEVVRVPICRPGREPGQGIGYLDDGTMVVVDGGEQLIGHEVVIDVTSIVQNRQGRMLFGVPVGGAS